MEVTCFCLLWSFTVAATRSSWIWRDRSFLKEKCHTSVDFPPCHPWWQPPTLAQNSKSYGVVLCFLIVETFENRVVGLFGFFLGGGCYSANHCATKNTFFIYYFNSKVLGLESCTDSYIMLFYSSWALKALFNMPHSAAFYLNCNCEQLQVQ